MKIYNRYIVSTAIVLLLTSVILIAAGQSNLDVYYSAYVIEALIITELHAYFNNKARRGLGYVSVILFGGFLIALCLQVIKIIT